jgi:hypothetical protein
LEVQIQEFVPNKVAHTVRKKKCENMEEKKDVVDTTTDSPASENKGNDSATKVEGDKKPDADVDKIDYKAELEKVKTQLKQAEYTIQKEKEKSKSDTKKDEDKVDVIDIDEEDVGAKASAIAKTEIEKFKMEQTLDVLEDEISKLATSPEHAELIKLTYQNRINKSGFNRKAIVDDLMAAALLVDRPKFERQLKEMAKTVISSKTTNTSGSTSSAKVDEGTQDVELSAADRKVMQKFGLTEKDLIK